MRWLTRDPLGRLYTGCTLAAWFLVCIIGMRGGLS